ncbi:scavenger receptor class B member 1-like protein [Dinothrombium tinctorium]|uniref:Scavenger receptor class B member 1 n=1 Tax=Dinothrombium tinctorium TaxID=1965070 RepID=A0A443QR78_9ACAR|nr:scavenger receptor class B member 1-like protein [Dinothrombium tinctorium]
MSHGAKPVLTEIGPFTYRLHVKRFDIVFNDNDTVSYREKKTWFFEPSLSVDSEDAKIVTLNAPLVMAFTYVQQFSYSLQKVLMYALKHTTEKLFIERKVKELTFDGYDDTLVAIASVVNSQFAQQKGKFSFFGTLNDTDDGVLTVHTGKNIHLLSIIDRYNGQKSLRIWSGEECNRLNDSASGQFPPPILEKRERVKLFIPRNCRPFVFDFNSIFTTKDNLRALKYVLNKNTLSNSSDYPPNICFGSDLPKKSNQTKSSFFDIFSNLKQEKQTLSFPFGVIDISKCLFGAPILISLPHFLHADSFYFDNIDGLSPNVSIHDLWLAIQPLTGGTIDMAFRSQVNIHISVPNELSHYKNAPQIVFPIFWQEIKSNFILKFFQQFFIKSDLPETEVNANIILNEFDKKEEKMEAE